MWCEVCAFMSLCGVRCVGGRGGGGWKGEEVCLCGSVWEGGGMVGGKGMCVCLLVGEGGGITQVWLAGLTVNSSLD